MKIAAIIPVKTFSKAKTRLNLTSHQTESICRIMLEEVVRTISNTKKIDKIIVVSKDETALKLSKKFGAHEIFDNDESGVNHAISLLRMPVNLMKTHYDEDSYKIHLEVGKSLTSNTSLIFLRRIMLDIDNQEDLDFLFQQNDKPEFCSKIREIY